MIILDEDIGQKEKFEIRKFKRTIKQIGFEIEKSGIKYQNENRNQKRDR